ncbi:hypothetical protein L195_g059563 [Trifolium pratense]|uniref:Uncharacterized protein n=1 Tax=Trifolium pratense TaxID=57577 RepID=A0A2K3JYW3_TRIPR|nr:hypothetical protein L195_g059563 [Trifolium pratense]
MVVMVPQMVVQFGRNRAFVILQLLSCPWKEEPKLEAQLKLSAGVFSKSSPSNVSNHKLLRG